MKKSLDSDSDGQQLNRYQQNERQLVASNHWTYRDLANDVEYPGPVLG